LAWRGTGEPATNAIQTEKPVAQEGGALEPIQRGWLLRRVERTRPWQLLPPGTRGTLVGASMLSLLGMASGLLTATHYPELLVWLYVSSVLPMLCAPVLAEKRLRHLAARRPFTRSLAERRRGDVVKVRGRVREGATFETAGLRRPAVLACYAGTVTYVTGHITDGLERPWHETRGFDFTVDLPSGEALTVRVRGVYFVPQPPETRPLFWGRNLQTLPSPLRRRASADRRGAMTEVIFGETSLGPADEVEVVGVLDHEVSPEATAAGRGARLHPVLRAGSLTPLLVRRCSDDHGD
jgi:hypothetical protein